MVMPAIELSGFLEGDVVNVAQRLIGATLRTQFEGLTTAVVVTEVEAYGGPNDAASHAARGRTEANAAMFGQAGTLYVYRSYGIHWCANVVIGAVGEPSAILLRGGDPVVGSSTMERRRKRTRNLTDGPGKLCQALGINGEHDGELLGESVELIPGPTLGPVVATPRIGITKATDLPWRFAVLR
jgi:DNA-3-methyladenine glycosylase